MKDKFVFATERYGCQPGFSGIIIGGDVSVFNRPQAGLTASVKIASFINFGNQSEEKQYSVNY